MKFRAKLYCLAAAALFSGSAQASEDESPKNDAEKTLIVLGDSIAAGHGVERDEAFPAVLERELKEHGADWRVINAGVSGDTTASGSRRIQWVLKQGAGALLIELGGNDGLRGIPPETTQQNLLSIIDQAREVDPGIVIILVKMRMGANMGERYTTAFEKVYDDVSKEKDVVLTPFLLEGIGADPAFNQSDLIHPNAEGHRVIVKTLLPTVLSALGKDGD